MYSIVLYFHQVVNIDDDYVSLMDEGCETREDLKLPSDDALAKKIKDKFMADGHAYVSAVTYLYILLIKVLCCFHQKLSTLGQTGPHCIQSGDRPTN